MKINKSFLSLFAISLLATSASAQIFYKIEGNGLEKPSYLFGTHHMAPISIIETYNLPQYMDETEQVVGEIDLTQDPMAIGMAMQSHMLAPADSTLSKVIPPEDYLIIDEEFKKWAPIPGADLTMFEPLKPMVVTTTVTAGIMSKQIPDYDPQNQLDTYFMKKGQQDGKKITGLETPEFQASVLFDITPISVQAEDLVEMLKEPQKLVDSSKKLNDAYMSANLDKMMELTEDEDSNSEFMIAILDKRNAEWLTKLPDIMADAPAFIAVGALHLAGDKGLVEGLRKLGYTVSPVEVAVALPAE